MTNYYNTQLKFHFQKQLLNILMGTCWENCLTVLWTIEILSMQEQMLTGTIMFPIIHPIILISSIFCDFAVQIKHLKSLFLKIWILKKLYTIHFNLVPTQIIAPQLFTLKQTKPFTFIMVHTVNCYTLLVCKLRLLGFLI